MSNIYILLAGKTCTVMVSIKTLRFEWPISVIEPYSTLEFILKIWFRLCFKLLQVGASENIGCMKSVELQAFVTCDLDNRSPNVSPATVAGIFRGKKWFAMQTINN